MCMRQISLVAFANIICVVLSFSVYLLDDESTTSDSAKRDLNASDIESAHHLEPGEVEPERFRYENSQIEGLDRPIERCYDDLNRCLLSSISNPRPVCAYNKLGNDVNYCKESAGYLYGTYNIKYCFKRTFRSYCDAYFDNCKRGYRYWRILDSGRCDYDRYKTHGGYFWGKDYFTVIET